MKKITRLSTLAVVLAFSVGTAVAAISTITDGYAQNDAQDAAGKMSGFSLKCRYEQGNSPLGVIGSFIYTEKDRTDAFNDYSKAQYYGIAADPVYRLDDWANTYDVVSVGYGEFQNVESSTYNHSISGYDLSHGIGLQFNPIESVALDFPYEQSRIRSVDVDTWIAGVGYHF